MTHKLPDIEVIYDGACPICNHFACALNDSANIKTINAREPSDRLTEAEQMDLDIDRGLIVYSQQKFYYGTDALQVVANNTQTKGVLGWLNRNFMRHKIAAKILYPFGVLARRVLLFVLRRPLITVSNQHNFNNETNPLKAHMGSAFDRLAPLLQQTHTGKTRLTGKVQVEHGNWVAKLICIIFRFPKSGTDIDLTVDCEHRNGRMTWERDFNGQRMYSYFNNKGKFLVEHLGPMALNFTAVENEQRIRYDFGATRFLGIPMPKFLSPRVVAGERAEGDEYVFHVLVNMFLIGPVISYRGKLKLEVLEPN